MGRDDARHARFAGRHSRHARPARDGPAPVVVVALWVGTDEGRVELYRLDDDQPERPLALRTRPDQCWNNLGGGVITSLAVMVNDGDLGGGMAVATTDAGSVHVLRTAAAADDKDVVDPQQQPQTPVISFTPPFVQPGIYPTCATVVAHKGDDDNDDDDHYSIVCGANDGSMSIHPLRINHLDEDDDKDGSIEITLQASRKLERHFGPVQCLTSPAPGLLLSTALDGTMRMTKVEEEEEDRSLYHITGYSSSTVGSVWSDGTRIVAANGAFQTLTVYDFAASANAADQNSRKDKQRRDDWNNNEDDNLSF